MDFSVLLAAALPVVSTFIGGFTVLRWKKDLHPWLSLSGGILLGVAFLNLLPEALEHGIESGVSVELITGFVLAAILLFHFLDKVLSFHAHHEHAHGESEEHCSNDRHKETKAYIRASSIILHSLLDGVAIGSSFLVDAELGMLVTLAVMLHAFSDGMSTVTFLKMGLGHGHKSMKPVLFINAFAPLVGALIGSALGISEGAIALMLALFCGFFIFLSLSELLPQAHSGRLSRRAALSLTVIGVLLVAFIRQLGGH